MGEIVDISRRGKLSFGREDDAASPNRPCRGAAARGNAVLLCKDEFLMRLPEEIWPIATVVSARPESRTRSPRTYVASLRGVGRYWTRQYKQQQRISVSCLNGPTPDLESCLIVASDDLCKRQLKQRSERRGLPPGTKWTTEADFDEVTALIRQQPKNISSVVRHERLA